MPNQDLERIIQAALQERGRGHRGNTNIIQRGDRRSRAIGFQDNGLTDMQLDQLIDRQQDETRYEHREQADREVFERNLIKEETQKAHVNPWAEHQADQSKRRQRASDLEFEMFKKWATDPNNGASAEEINQVSQQIAQKAATDSTINPQVLYRAEDDESNPINRKARAAEAMARQYSDMGYTADDFVSLLYIDPKTGATNAGDLMKQLDTQREGSKPNRMDISAVLKATNSQIDSLKKDPNLFDQNTGAMKETPGYWSSQAAKDAHAAARLQFEALVGQQEEYSQMLQGLVSPQRGATTDPGATVPPPTPVPTNGQFIAKTAGEEPAVRDAAIAAARAAGKSKALIYVPGPSGTPVPKIIDIK